MTKQEIIENHLKDYDIDWLDLNSLLIELDKHDGETHTKLVATIALESLLEYAKYLEDNGQLSYGLLKDRVETYKK